MAQHLAIFLSVGYSTGFYSVDYHKRSVFLVSGILVYISAEAQFLLDMYICTK